MTEAPKTDALRGVLSKLDPARREAVRAHFVELAWLEGNLEYKLHAGQRKALRRILGGNVSRFVMEIARRWGKTFLLVVYAVTICLRKPGARVVYAAQTLKDLIEFIIPTLEKVTADAPNGLGGRYDVARGHWVFPNGSYIHLGGCDDKRKANRMRGPGADAVIVDEAGFIPILRYVLRSVLRPQLLHSGGRMLLGSTPAELPDHDFTALAERAEANGYYMRSTLYENPTLTPERIAAFIAEDALDAGLSPEAYQETDEFRREYLALRVVDKLLLVVPEWTVHGEACTRELPRPEYFDAMTVLDFGGADPHAAVFTYWDFRRAMWVIEDELLLKNGENTQQLARAIRSKETALWGSTLAPNGALRVGLDDPDKLRDMLPSWLLGILEKEAPEQPYARWCDNDIQLARDLYELHQLAFIPTAKDALELQVNALRLLVASEQLAVHPRCVHTVRHLRTTTWENHKRKGWARIAGEHGDCLATLVYGCRNLDRQRNPEPAHMHRLRTLGEEHRAAAEAEANQPGIYRTALGRRLMGRR